MALVTKVRFHGKKALTPKASRYTFRIAIHEGRRNIVRLRAHSDDFSIKLSEGSFVDVGVRLPRAGTGTPGAWIPKTARRWLEANGPVSHCAKVRQDFLN